MVCSPPTGRTATGTGIGIAVTLQSGDRVGAVHLLNGTIRGMGANGIAGGRGFRVEAMTVVSNAGFGIGGDIGTVIASHVAQNGLGGLVGNLMMPQDSQVILNGGKGANFNIASAGKGNIFGANGAGSFSGMQQLGPNLCDTSLCP